MKAIEEAAREYAFLQGPFCGDCSELREAFVAGAEYVEHNGWQSPSEKMPEDYASVLLAYHDKTIIIGYYDPNCKMWRSAHSHEEICDPLAWREAPRHGPQNGMGCRATSTARKVVISRTAKRSAPT